MSIPAGCVIIPHMNLSIDEVRHIARLARLALSEEEVQRYSQQLSDILVYADRLRQVDTSDIPPTASVLPVRNVLREDVSHPGLSPADLLRNAPESIEEQFRVPPILE